MGRQAMASTGGTETEMVRSMEQTQHPALRGALTGLVRHAERPAFAHVGADAALGHVRAAAATLRVGEMPARLALMDTTSIVNRAGDVMRGVFYFTKPWDMERCATPFELPANPYEIDWCVVNNDDEEWCFMLNRMDYLEDLAAAFLATGNVEYARHALDLVLAWVAAHPAIEPRLSTRTLDTGIRLRSWARVLPVLEFAGVLGLDSMARILRSAGDQIDYLGERYLPKYETSNWGSIQTCAIVETVLMLAGAGNDEGCYAWALERLASQLPAQVYPDGVDWELSPMYHIEVMLYVLGTRAALERCGLEVPSSIDSASRGLSRGLAMQTMPGCVIDAVGDSDRLAVNGVVALSAALLRSGELKYISGVETLDALDLMAYGCGVADALCGVPAVVPQQRVFDGEDSGTYAARGSWGQHAGAALFLNGPLGSGHGHSDNLHVSLWVDGLPVLVDSGRYTYREDVDMRPWLKGPYAHNGLMVDGSSSSAPKGSWGYSDFCQPLKTYARHSGRFHYWEGAVVEHDPCAVLVRKALFIDEGILVGCDEVHCTGDHQLTSLFHFDPQLELEALAEEGADDAYGDLGVRYSVRRAGEEVAVFCAEGDCTVEEGECSLDYNQLSTQRVAKVASGFTDSAARLWCVVPAGVRVEDARVWRNADEAVGRDLASALRITTRDGSVYTVAFFHREAYSGVKAFALEGVSFHGKAAVVSERDGKRTLHLMRA